MEFCKMIKNICCSCNIFPKFNNFGTLLFLLFKKTVSNAWNDPLLFLSLSTFSSVWIERFLANGPNVLEWPEDQCFFHWNDHKCHTPSTYQANPVSKWMVSELSQIFFHWNDFNASQHVFHWNDWIEIFLACTPAVAEK